MCALLKEPYGLCILFHPLNEDKMVIIAIPLKRIGIDLIQMPSLRIMIWTLTELNIAISTWKEMLNTNPSLNSVSTRCIPIDELYLFILCVFCKSQIKHFEKLCFQRAHKQTHHTHNTHIHTTYLIRN